MKDYFFQIRTRLIYWLQKEDKYSQQSPLIFEIYSKMIQFLEENKKGNHEVEQFRKSLLKDDHTIEVLDLGAGSKKNLHSARTISSITRYSTSGVKFAQLYQYFCGLTPAQNVLELGTCVGISTRYLCEKTKGTLFTFEGSSEIQKVAQRPPSPSRTEFVLGPIEKTLPKLLSSISSVDFALIDANHTYEGTIHTFMTLLPKLRQGSILAIGDIHWSPAMEKAWREIKAHPSVRLTFDFYECGVLFFNFSGQKSHLILEV